MLVFSPATVGHVAFHLSYSLRKKKIITLSVAQLQYSRHGIIGNLVETGKTIDLIENLKTAFLKSNQGSFAKLLL